MCTRSKLHYFGVDNRRNGVGIVRSPEMKARVIQVFRESDFDLSKD